MKKLMVLCCTAMVTCILYAETVVTNGYTWTYSVSSGKATLWAVRPSPTGTLEIPAVLAGNPLDVIGDSVFQGCNGLVDVTIPDVVSSIGYCAFSGCSSLTLVKIPVSVTSICEMAFADCTSLAQVELPNDVRTLSVGSHAFDDVTVVDAAERRGYALCWTNDAGEVISDPFHSETAVTVSPCWQRVLPWDYAEGLVAHYTFNGNANDDSGNGNNGVLHGVTPTADRHGNADGAYHFDGTSAYIEVVDSDSLREVGQTVTLSAWVKPEALTSEDGLNPYWISVLCKGNDSGNNTTRQYGIQIGKDKNWLIDYYSGVKNNSVYSSKSMALHAWSHIAVTFTPTAILGYLNGELVGTSTPHGPMIENADSLFIGFDPPEGDEYLSGDMDEVRIYNRVLSSAEVRALSNGDNPIAAVIGEGTHVYHYNVGDGIGIVQAGIGSVDSSLNIPATIGNTSVIAIGRYAFADCGDIEVVMIPSSVAEIGDSAFAGCSNLSQVKISGDIGTLTVGGNAFDAATEVVIGDKQGYELVGWTNAVGRVMSDPFHSTSPVTVMPVWQRVETDTINGYTWTFVVSDNGKATIGNGKNLGVDPVPTGDLSIPDEINGYPVTGIGKHAFAGCEELTSIMIPSNVTSIGYGAFEGCYGLTNVILRMESIDCMMPGLIQAKFNTRFDTTSTLDDSDDAANVSGVIAAYTHLDSEDAPWEFPDPLNGNVFAWNETNTTFAYFGQMYLDVGKTYVFGTHFDDDSFVKIDDTIAVNVEIASKGKIYSGQFECSRSGWYDVEFRLGDKSGGKGSWCNIWSIDFGAGYRDDGSTDTTQSGWSRLLDPGDGSLFRCDGTRTIFAGCSNIVSVTMPWSLVSRMSSMFPDAYDKLESITLTGETDAIPAKAFAGCASLRSLEIPDSVTRIGDDAFQNCRQVTNMDVPNSVTNIGYGVFSGCMGLQGLTLPFVGSERGNSLVQEALFGHIFGKLLTEGAYEVEQYYIGTKNNGNNGESIIRYIPSSLTDVVISDETLIAKGAFDNCHSITNLKLNAGIASIGEFAFAHCYGMKCMVIPHGARNIEECAFEDCGNLVNVELPPNIVVIGKKAFYECADLSDVMISNSVVNLYVGENAFNVNTTVGMEAREGFILSGWTNATGSVVSDPFHSATSVTVSPWWRKIVNVGYDANGGHGEMAMQTVIEGDSLSLSANAFARDGYSFMGWSLSVGGEMAYPDMAEFAKVSARMDGVVLYAVWKPQPPVISLEGGAEFQNASRFVSLSCDTGDALILFTKDGDDPRASGHVYKDPIYIYGTCTLRAVACGAGHYSDEVSATLTRTEGLSEAANLYGYLMETDEDSPWTIVTDVSRDGVSSVRSGTVGHGGMTWLQTSVRKAGTISFWWRAACEDAEDEEGETYWYDYGSFSVDGVEKARIAGNDTGWRKIEVDVPTSGKHVLRWEYSKDGAASYSPDCIWLDQVQWVPADGSGYTLTTPDPVPYTWLSSLGLGLESDFETVARQTIGKYDANGRPVAVWEDYVAGTVPTDANDLFRAIISMQDDGPHISWTPNLNTNGEVRVYRVWGKADLKDSAWTYPANPKHRFFKVTVELP